MTGIDEPQQTAPSQALTVRLTVNGTEHTLLLDPRVSLLDALREYVGLTGTKKGCNQGACGACTVLVDGERINSCLTLAVMHEGRQITTVEGLAQDDTLHPLQAAFIKHDGFQCGYCTPGQLCSAIAMLDELTRGTPSRLTPRGQPPAFSDAELRERMSGNLCRCGAYTGIFDAISDVHEQTAQPQLAAEPDAPQGGNGA